MDQRENLIQSLQNEGWIKNPLLIEAFQKIDRKDFVPEEYWNEAYGNYPLSIGRGQTISQPLTVAFMLELLQPQPGEKILDVGSGSGWTTALLAEIAVKNSGQVIGIERIPELCAFGQKNLAKYFTTSQAKIICGDGTRDLQKIGPFNKILAGAAADNHIPDAWKKELAIGGRIVAPIDNSIYLFIKKTESTWERKEYKGFTFVPLLPRVASESAPHDKNEKKLFLKKIIIFLTATVILLAGVTGYLKEIYYPHTSYKENTTIEITPGLGSRKIGEALKKSGIIRSKWAFVTYVSIYGTASFLKPGTYIFGQDTIPEIAKKLVAGASRERSITVPEGWSRKEIGEYLETEHFITKKEEFLSATDEKNTMAFKKNYDTLRDIPANASLEGYLFPDTYRVYENTPVADIVTKMLANFDAKLTPDTRQEIGNQKKTIFEIVTMASLIEKEVRSDEDRAVISGILWKRIKLDIPLQVDATIIYITGKNTVKVSRNDTKINSPYNTYKYRGLPHGPITNPGVSAIHAAVFPKSSPYLFYLSAPDGKTIFSRTLEEHNTAKAKYLK